MKLFNKLNSFLESKDKEYKSNNEKIDKCVSCIIDENKNNLQQILIKSHDIIYREAYLEKYKKKVLLVCIEGMVEKDIVSDQILKALKEEKLDRDEILSLDKISNEIITALEVNRSNDFNELLDSLFLGNTLLFLDGYTEALMVGTTGWSERNIEAPFSEETVRGSREGFVESVVTNITLVRKRIKTPKLAVEIIKIGKNTHTEVAILYLEDVMNSDIVNEIKSRIQQIDTDGIVGSAQVEQLIEPNNWTIFPQVLATERVDRAVGNILEGRVLIIVDGTPFTLIAPVTFTSFLNSPDDYYERSMTSSFLRMIRYISYFLTTTLPALYLALTTFHPGMIPTPLVLTITGSRIGLPFPTVVEVFIMEFTIEILTEASIRLPKPIGQTVSIVGGLVIGQAAVQAGIVSPLIIVIISLTALTSFSIPIYTFTLGNRMIRFPLIILAAFFGLYGIFMGWIFLLIHLASLESFGIRYLSDFSPYKLDKLKDTIVKMPQGFLSKRPEILKVEDINRQNPK